MDEVNDFFDFSKDFDRGISRRCNNAPSAPLEAHSVSIKRECSDSGCLQKKQKLPKLENIAESNTFSYDNVNDDEEVETVINAVDDGVYDRYVFDLRRDESLPVHDFKEDIVTAIRKCPVLIVEGNTGCGKTTQVPQYILDDSYRRREYCKIICTQPRRIAAISIARRVSKERKWKEGTVVGYQVGLHANVSEDTRLLYCTAGVLLQKLIREKSLTQFTHIILDEVHERDQDMDFLLLIVRHLLKTNSKHVKVVLMSATINTVEFEDYFKMYEIPSQVICVDKRRLFQVREFYLDDLDRINNTDTEADFSDPGISTEMYNIALKLVVVIDNIEKQEATINVDTSGSANNTSILIFLPGINEIDEMLKRLEQLNESDDVKLSPIRLHSLIPPDEQIRVFHCAPEGYRKVILATNIAESSITVPDVKYVIDFCLTKSLITDTLTNFATLQLHWASRANCRQRAGRAGRVMNGRVYRMITKEFYEKNLDEYNIPEMLRCPLENVVLKAKLLDMGAPPDVLCLALSPPNLSDIRNTILTLKELGALYTHLKDTYSEKDGDISFMGRIMESLPLDIRLSRLILLGYVFSVLDESIIIAAGLNLRSIFKYSHNNKQSAMDAYLQKLVWADGSGSDLIAILRAYEAWASLADQGNIKAEDEHAWANRYFINLRSIKEMHLLIQELRDRLKAFGIKEQTTNYQELWTESEKSLILKVVIAGAFYPNYFICSSLSDIDQERKVHHTLCGYDPCKTVYFTNFNTLHIGQLYTHQIKGLLADVHIPPHKVDVRFQSGSERVFIIFKDDSEEEQRPDNNFKVPGRVRPEVYKAIRMRMSGMRPTIHVMDSRAGAKYAEDHGFGVMSNGIWQPTKRLLQNAELNIIPSVFQRNIRGCIAHIENCSKFYFQPLSEMERINEINSLLNAPQELKGRRFRSPASIYKGMLLSAPFDHKYYRAKVLEVISTTYRSFRFRVSFVDYGNTAILNFEDLRPFSERCSSLANLPPRVFKCRLAMIEPSVVKSANNAWADKAMELLQECADAGTVEIEIYSVVEGVSNVFIKIGDSTFNSTLVEKGLARESDESYSSKTDHDLRLRKQSVASRFLDEDQSRQNEEYLRSMQPETDLDLDPPSENLCRKSISLRGPFSPLETTVSPAVRVGAWKSVQIERESVNSVLLDTDPQDLYERLVVAGGINETKNRETLVVRATTLMPNIHGFGAFVTMLFCPTMQIKCNKERTKYVAVLAGLGCDENTCEPLYQEHDVVLNLDVDILTNDLELINELRYCMNTFFYTNPGDERPSISTRLRSELSAKIKSVILRLLSKNRKYIDTHVSANDSVWERYDPNEVIETGDVHGRRSLFPMLVALQLYDEKYDRIHSLTTHCEQLHRLRQFNSSTPNITCRLCKQPIENITQLRLHLLSQLHRDREHQIHFKPSHLI